MRHPSATQSTSIHLAFLILALSSVGAQAQDAGLTSTMQAMTVGQRVRVDVSQVGRLEGRFLVANGATLTLDRDDVPVQLRLPDIERLWVRGRSTRRGALVGALVGVAFGIWIGTEAADVCDIDGEPCFTTAEAAAVGGLLSGAGGAVVGAGIGFAIPTWRLRFP